MSTLQYAILRIAHATCRSCIRHVPWGVGQRFIWSQICRPYLNWHQFSAVTPTFFGSSVTCNVADLIQAHIYYFGQWEPSLTAFLARRLRIGDTFIDVGANIGYFSLLASSLVGPEGNVIAIEASPSIYEQLVGNIKRNSVKNIRAVNVAASDHHGAVDIYRGAAGNQGSTSLVKALGTTKEATVQAVPLDQIISNSELSTCRVIKIDIEGSELPVLECIINRIKDFSSDVNIVVELTRPEFDTGHTANRVIENFKDAGFFCYYLDNEFSISRYLGKSVALPARRLTTAILERTDLVFSREEADFV